MTQGNFDKAKKILQREIKTEDLSTFEYNLLDNFLGEVRRNLVIPESFNKKQINYAFLAGRRFSSNYHFEDLLKDEELKNLK